GHDPTVTTWGEYVIIHNSDAGIYVYRITEWTDGSASSPPPSNWPIRHVFEAGPSANVGDVQLSADGSRVLLQEGNRVVVLDGETETTRNVGQDGHVEGSPGGGIALSADGSTAEFWSSTTDMSSVDDCADCSADRVPEVGSLVLLQEGNRVGVLDGETETTLNVGQDVHVEGSPGGGIALSADGSTPAFWSSATDLTGDDVSADCPADSEQECGSLFFYDML